MTTTLTRVEAYYNLHKQCISYRPIGGTVRHAYAVTLTDATLSVQPAGRRRVLEEKRKNVHAFVRGLLTGSNSTSRKNLEAQIRAISKGGRSITYNPYLFESFVYVDTKEPVFDPIGDIWIVGKNIWEVPK